MHDHAGVNSVILPHQTVVNPVALRNALITHKVTHCTAVPTVLQALLIHVQSQDHIATNPAQDTAPSAPTQAAAKLHAPSYTAEDSAAAFKTHSSNAGGSPAQKACLRLKVLVSSGEQLPLQLARSLQQVLPTDCKLLNLYGCTEVAADCTRYDMTHMADASAHMDLKPVHMAADPAHRHPSPAHTADDSAPMHTSPAHMAANTTQVASSHVGPHGHKLDPDTTHDLINSSAMAATDHHSSSSICHQPADVEHLRAVLHSSQTRGLSIKDESMSPQAQRNSTAVLLQPSTKQAGLDDDARTHVQSHVEGHVQDHVPVGWPITGFAVLVLQSSSPAALSPQGHQGVGTVSQFLTEHSV